MQSLITGISFVLSKPVFGGDLQPSTVSVLLFLTCVLGKSEFPCLSVTDLQALSELKKSSPHFHSLSPSVLSRLKV